MEKLNNPVNDGSSTERPSGLRRLSSWAEMAERSNIGYAVDMNDSPGRLVPNEILPTAKVLSMMDEFCEHFDGSVDSLSQTNPANPNDAYGGQGTLGA